MSFSIRPFRHFPVHCAVPRFQVAWRLKGAPFRCLTLVALGLISISVGACTRAAVEMDPLELARLKENPRIGAVHYKAPEVKVYAYANNFKAQLNCPFSAQRCIEEDAHDLGAQIVGEPGLEDPTLELKTRFITAVTTELGLTSIENIPQSPSPEDYLMLRHKFRDGFLFLFHSTVVTFRAFPLTPLSPTRYHLGYGGKGELWSFKAGRTVWESSCGRFNDNASHDPTLEELTANQGQLLKQMVSEATKECASQLVAHFLGSGKASKSIAAP
jgi:hypothetical protein